MYILIQETTYFVDPHGSCDFGSEKYELVNLDEVNENSWKKELSKMEENTEYCQHEDCWNYIEREYGDDRLFIPWEEAEENAGWQAEDGYNYEVTSYTYKVVPDEKVEVIKSVLKNYENIWNL